MSLKKYLQNKLVTSLALVVGLAVLAVTMVMVWAQPASSMSIEEMESQAPFFNLQGALNPSQTIMPNYVQPSGTRDFNFSLAVTGGDLPIDLTIRDSNNAIIWDGSVGNGEIVWGSGTLRAGTNNVTLTNNGTQSANFDLEFFDLPATPYLWDGASSPTGLNSVVRVTFPQDGLYQFNFGVNVGERYVFMLDSNYIEKTVEANTSAVFFVEAGIHDLTIIQSATGGMVDWDVDIAFTNDDFDTLPYQKDSDNINEEWLPIVLENPAEVNLAISVDGSNGDHLMLEVLDGATAVNGGPVVQHNVEPGEDFWSTFDLPAGPSLIHLTTISGTIDYDLTIDALPVGDYSWTGSADADGENSHVRVTFDTAGLYQFGFLIANGRYQFQLDVDGDKYIQKTIEQNDNFFTYYIPAGTHDLYIDQDTTVGATIWATSFTLDSVGNNSLPYDDDGEGIGGAGNDFTSEWAPISLDAATQANLRIMATGDADDSLMVAVYHGMDSTPSYSVTQVLGTEQLWANFDLEAGMNRLQIIAMGNANVMAYDLDIEAVPSGGTAAWDGNSLDNGLNSAILVDFDATGLYQFQIDSSAGFANLVLDDAMTILRGPNGGTNLGTTYDVMVDAGTHEVYVLQDSNFMTTTWSASVAPVAMGSSFFNLDGVLETGESITPMYTVPSGTLDFNFALTVSGGDVDLDITDGGASQVWSGTALDGETIWGTGTLNGNNDVTLTNLSGGNVSVDLTFYYLPAAAYDWVGVADAAGVNSEARVIFGDSGLYTFDLGVNSGRYQFTVNGDYIQKTAESSSSVTYYIPAGTHTLAVNQDTVTGADWNISISAVGASNDSLPYNKVGGDIGGVDNDFVQEWLPIELAEASEVNMAMMLTGTDGDSALVEVFDGSLTEVLSVVVYANETNWSTFDLDSGISRLKVTADPGNVDPVSYDLTIYELPAPAYIWDGNADFRGANSHARVTFATSGLYTFDLGVDSGRYQFLINDDFIQKTVEGDTAVTYYIPAGTHDLYIDQDTTLGADWDVTISGPGAADDSLAYTKSGGNIGGVGNDFDEEWLTIHTGSDMLVNIAITLTGDMTDSLMLTLWDDTAQTLMVDPIYGTETVWEMTLLPGNGRIHLAANGGNSNALAYELSVQPLPQPPYGWQGRSLGNGLNSTVQLDIPVTGVYALRIDIEQGFTQFIIDGGVATTSLEGGFTYTVTLPLTAGLHTFTSQQDTNAAVTEWSAQLTLLTDAPPEITAVSPNSTTEGITTSLSIYGANFQTGAIQVALVDDSSTYTLSNILYISSTLLMADVPASVPPSTYDVVVINPDSQSDALVDGFVVLQILPPTVSSITPSSSEVGERVLVTVQGSDFLSGAMIKLVMGANEYWLTNVAYVSASSLTGEIPSDAPKGVYDVVVVNADTQTDTLSASYEITDAFTFVPLFVTAP